MINRFSKVVVFIFCLLVGACSKVSKDTVYDDFRELFDNENQVISSIYISEGDADHLYYSITYENVKSFEKGEVEFLYKKNLIDNTWYLHKVIDKKLN